MHGLATVLTDHSFPFTVGTMLGPAYSNSSKRTYMFVCMLVSLLSCVSACVHETRKSLISFFFFNLNEQRLLNFTTRRQITPFSHRLYFNMV